MAEDMQPTEDELALARARRGDSTPSELEKALAFDNYEDPHPDDLRHPDDMTAEDWRQVRLVLKIALPSMALGSVLASLVWWIA